MSTATTARIRRCNRATEFAIAQSAGVLAIRPDAKPTGQDDYTIESFFDVTAHAQVMLAEKFTILSSNRRCEAAEAADPLRLGEDIPISPALSSARMIDSTRNLDSVMLIKGIAIDLETDRNSIEAVGLSTASVTPIVPPPPYGTTPVGWNDALVWDDGAYWDDNA